MQPRSFPRMREPLHRTRPRALAISAGKRACTASPESSPRSLPRRARPSPPGRMTFLRALPFHCPLGQSPPDLQTHCHGNNARPIQVHAVSRWTPAPPEGPATCRRPHAQARRPEAVAAVDSSPSCYVKLRTRAPLGVRARSFALEHRRASQWSTACGACVESRRCPVPGKYVEVTLRYGPVTEPGVRVSKIQMSDAVIQCASVRRYDFASRLPYIRVTAWLICLASLRACSASNRAASGYPQHP